jgi:putative addiction module component (TIGR02574 family)
MDAGKAMSDPGVSIESLSPEEQLELLERLWESLSKEPSNVPLTELQRAELDRRLDSLDEDVRQGRVLGVPWDEVVRQIRTRG